MRLEKILGVVSVMAIALGASACASVHAGDKAALANGAAPKARPSTLHRYDPFTDPFDALNNPLVGQAAPPARAGRPVPH